MRVNRPILPAVFFGLSMICFSQTAHVSDPNLHYAYSHSSSDGNEHLEVNWKGAAIWTKSAAADVLWVRQGDKVFQITDKATLQAMDAATRPLRRSTVSAKLGTQQWQAQREVERNAVYKKTDQIVKQAMAKGLGKPVSP